MKRSTGAVKRSARKSSKSDPAESYDRFKEHEGQRYTGMRIGRSHKWYYDKGEWKETKITPDLWHISYAVKKRATSEAWNATPKTQRGRMVKFLRNIIEDLEREPAGTDR